jgi:hypothetical protein
MGGATLLMGDTFADSLFEASTNHWADFIYISHATSVLPTCPGPELRNKGLGLLVLRLQLTTQMIAERLMNAHCCTLRTVWIGARRGQISESDGLYIYIYITAHRNAGRTLAIGETRSSLLPVVRGVEWHVVKQPWTLRVRQDWRGLRIKLRRGLGLRIVVAVLVLGLLPKYLPPTVMSD